MKPRFFVVLALLPILAAPALAIPHVHLRGITIGGGYSHFSGPYGYYPYYSPYSYPGLYPGWVGFYDPFWGPFGPALAYDVRSADKGEVHLKDAAPQAEIYIDGAYAGLAKDLRTLWLAPGAYNLEARTANREPVQKKIYVLTGKTLSVRLGEVKP